MYKEIRERDQKKKKFVQQSIYSQTEKHIVNSYLFMCLKLVLKNAHLVQYTLSVEKQTIYEYSYQWQILPKIFPSHHPRQNAILSSSSCNTNCKLHICKLRIARPHSCSLQKQDRMENKRLGNKRMRKIMVRQAYKRLDNIVGTEQKILLLFLELSAVLVNGLVCFLGWILLFFQDTYVQLKHTERHMHDKNTLLVPSPVTCPLCFPPTYLVTDWLHLIPLLSFKVWAVSCLSQTGSS